MLLEAGADPADRAGRWIRDDVPEGGYYEPGWTALMLAARGGHASIVKMLIECGASIQDVGAWGETAVLFAATANDVETINLLLAHGARLDQECRIRQFDEDFGWHRVGTPLHAAARCGWPEVTRCLLGHGAAVDWWLSLCGRTPLFYASAYGHHQAVNLLLRAGANPNLREHRSDSLFEVDFMPLHYAARRGDLETVRLLLNAGAVRAVEGSAELGEWDLQR